MLLLKQHCNYDQKTTLLYCCSNDVVITTLKQRRYGAPKERCDYNQKTSLFFKTFNLA